MRDLPAGAERRRSPSAQNECNPARRFERHTAAVIDAPRYGIGDTSFSHAVGIFDSDAAAEAALREFTSDENDHCVLAEMEQRALERTGRPTRGHLAALDVSVPDGFEAAATRFVITTLPDDRRYFDTVALRVGRSIVVVGCYAPERPTPASLRGRLIRLATRRLSSALDGG